MTVKLGIAVVGLGGVGNIVADALFPFTRAPILGWSLERLLFIDGDTYTQGNIPRQKAAGRMLGYNKADAWRTIYEKSKWNFMNTQFASSHEWVTRDNVARVLAPVVKGGLHCIVFACVDNFPARVVLSNYVKEIIGNAMDVVVIQGGCAKNYATCDLYGRWTDAVSDPVIVGRPIEENHPEVLEDTEGDRSRISCEELANSSSGDQTYVENFMAATMMMNLMFTLLTGKGGAVLSKHIGEVMEVTTHYHNIEKELPKDSLEETEDEKNDNVNGAGGEPPAGETVCALETPDGDDGSPGGGSLGEGQGA